MADPASNIRPMPTLVRPLTAYARTVASVKSERVSWLWPGRLALGKLTIVDGDPGLGKSTMTLDWAARISRGLPLPSDAENRGACIGQPRGVILLSAEDDEADTIRPRLEAAGADLNRVVLISLRDEHHNDFLLTLEQHVDVIEQQIESANAALVIIDPLMVYLGANVKSNNDQDVRRVLSPFTSMLARTRCACVVLRHLNKNAGMSSLYRGGGSIGIIGAARFGLLLARDPKDESGRALVLAVQKNNIGMPATSLACRLENVPGTDVARVEWLGESAETATNLLSDVNRAGVQDAAGWLYDSLKAGPVSTKDLQRSARDAGINWRTIEEAKRIMDVRSDRKGFGKDGVWRWHLPPGFTQMPHRDDPFEREDA